MSATESRQILIVDRDKAGVEPLCQSLSGCGFEVRAVTDGAAAVAAVAERPPHLVIVDWNMPGCAVLELIQAARRVRIHRMRLVILSALATEQDVVRGLDLGADDYIAKPYSVPEVVARVFAILRSRRADEQRTALCCDELILDAATSRVTVQGQLLNLRGVEYRLLEFLMVNQGRTFDRSELLEQVWGDTSELERTVDVNVQRLRKILSERGYEAYIQTVRGFGYRFAPPKAGSTDGGPGAVDAAGLAE